MGKIKDLSLDLETYSDVYLAKCGVYRYCESPNFEILLLGYSIDEAPVQVVDLASGEEVPEEVLDALTDDSVIKWAHNAAFERICLSRWLRQHYPERFVSYSVSEDSVGNYARFNRTSSTNLRSDLIPYKYPTSSILNMLTGSTDGRPFDG